MLHFLDLLAAEVQIFKMFRSSFVNVYLQSSNFKFMKNT